MRRIFDHVILLTISLLLLTTSCNKTEVTGDKKDKTNLDSSAAMENLEKLFHQSPSGLLDSVDLFCTESKSYQADAWEELNHCRWALEKQELAKIPEYAKRKGEVLSLQIDDGQWMALSHEGEPKENAKYFQFRKYLQAPHYFVITQHFASACPMQWFIDGKDGQRLFLPGTIWQHPKDQVFITGTNGKLNCPNEVHLVYFDKSEKVQTQRLKFSQKLLSVKWTANAALLQLENKGGKTEYRKWVLP